MSQLSALCYKLKISCEATSDDKLYKPDWPDGKPYRVKLRFQGRQLTVPFYQGSAHTSDPTAADVLSCLVSDTVCGEQSFEEFCSELGYNPNSRKAEATWKACVEVGPRVRRFIGDAFDEIASAEH